MIGDEQLFFLLWAKYGNLLCVLASWKNGFSCDKHGSYLHIHTTPFSTNGLSEKSLCELPLLYSGRTLSSSYLPDDVQRGSVHVVQERHFRFAVRERRQFLHQPVRDGVEGRNQTLQKPVEIPTGFLWKGMEGLRHSRATLR